MCVYISVDKKYQKAWMQIYLHLLDLKLIYRVYVLILNRIYNKLHNS